MVANFDRILDGRNVSEAEDEWDYAITFDTGSNVRKLVRALLSEADRIDEDLEAIYEDQHINSASGSALDEWGDLVNVSRKTGEANEKYRARIKAEFRQSTIGTTFDEFVEYSATVLDTDIDNLTFTFNFDGSPAQVTMAADPAVYDAVSLSGTEVQGLLEDAVPAGHEVEILEGGTFRLRTDGEPDDATKGLTSDSIETGGTLAQDIIQ